jgi:asparagine synthase (glutamine-hydrolysing)
MVEHPAALRLPIARKAARYVQQARVPMPDRLETYNLVLMLGADQIFTRDFLAQVDPHAPLRAQREVYQACTASALINRMLSYDWKYTLADNDLVKVRAAAQLAGIEVGFPLLDDALVDFSLRLAPDMKLKGSKLRYFFKEALKDFLPREIIAKKKHGFGLPFGPWLAQSPELQALARDALGSLERRNLVRPQLIGELLTTRLQTHAGYFGEMVWLLVTLEHWLRAHQADFRVEAPMHVARAG